jgi:hypothetical protein
MYILKVFALSYFVSRLALCCLNLQGLIVDILLLR